MRATHLLVAACALAAGWFAAGAYHDKHDHAQTKRVRFYQSPMHPWVKSDQPGKCTVCGMNLVPIYEDTLSFDHATDGLVMLPPGSPNVIGVQTAEVKVKPLVRTLRVAGTIGEDESRHGVISAPVEGRIEGLAVSHEGQPVAQRQPVATIFSRTLLAAADEYRAAFAEGGAALQKAALRLERCGLLAEQIRDIPQRQPDDKYFSIVSPLAGTIVKCCVSTGQYVREGDKIFEVADLTRMWFCFDVSERDLAFIKPRQVIYVSTPSLPGRALNQRVGDISPMFDPATHTARVRVVIENPDRAIKANSIAEGTIAIGDADALAVPRTAVLWPGAGPRVYVEKSPGGYEQRAVTLGRAGDEDWEVLAGLSEGERVVTSGGVLIDGQAQLNRDGAR